MNKKGFTLIELLAIIVILAVIALIGTPIVTRIINTSRINSAEQTCNGVIDATKNLYSIAVLRDASFDGGGITFDMDKTKPTAGTIFVTRDGSLKGAPITGEDGNVTYADSVLTVNGYTCSANMANESITSYTCK